MAKSSACESRFVESTLSRLLLARVGLVGLSEVTIVPAWDWLEVMKTGRPTVSLLRASGIFFVVGFVDVVGRVGSGIDCVW